jgi:hypothetical protein
MSNQPSPELEVQIVNCQFRPSNLTPGRTNSAGESSGFGSSHGDSTVVASLGLIALRNIGLRQRLPHFWHGILVIALAAATSLSGQVLPPNTNQTTAKPAAPKPANNSYCLTCHANFKNEDLSRCHQLVGVACAKCHGESDAHSSDEDGLTAPDIIYSHDAINAACYQCHARSKMEAVEAHLPEPKNNGKSLVCTECHGNHKLVVRTRRWDKTTRKLLSDDGVRMMQTNSPARSVK